MYPMHAGRSIFTLGATLIQVSNLGLIFTILGRVLEIHCIVYRIFHACKIANFAEVSSYSSIT